MTKINRNLIFLWTYLEWGGAQIYMLAIMKQAKPDWEIVVILPRDSPTGILGLLDQIGVKYDFIDAAIDISPAPTLASKLKRQWRRVHSEWTSFRYLKRFDLSQSILHVETLPWQSWIYLTALIARGANVFLTMHNALPELPLWREIVFKSRLQFLSRLPRFHIFTANHDAKDKLRGWVKESFWEDIKVTYASINPPEISTARDGKFDRAAMLKKINVPAGNFVVLCAGQFIDRKGRWVFLEAAKTVMAQDDGVSFVWLTPKLPNEVDTAKIAEYGLGDGFRLVRSETIGTERNDVLKFFRIADAFALASFVEGLPIALLEAMSLGIPSISTRVYAIPEAVKHLETGMLVEAGDSLALADAILQLKQDPELRERLSKQGSKWVLEEFDERETARIAIAAYSASFIGK
jgi:glycosyltransferase involved in cell wall biosynthesis